MLKHKVAAIVLSMVFLLSAKAYCQQTDLLIKSFSGKVSYMDIAGGVMDVESDTQKMEFYITVESDLYRLTHHIVSIEIEKGDPVIIQYARSYGKNVIIRLVDNKPGPFD